MNAYELAEHFKNDLLPHERHANHAETMYWVDQYRTFGKRVATMLRQQADRIAELEKFIKAILKKGGCDGNICKRYETHPVKQLSKYEISEIVDEIFGVQPSDDMTYFYDFYNAIIKEITE